MWLQERLYFNVPELYYTGYLRSSWTKLNSYCRQKTIHGVRNVICTLSLGHEICVFTFRMNFELRGWPSQPPTFSSNSTKITKNAQFRTSILTCWRLCWLASKFKIHSKGKNTNVRTYGTCTCHVSDPHGVFSV